MNLKQLLYAVFILQILVFCMGDLMSQSYNLSYQKFNEAKKIQISESSVNERNFFQSYKSRLGLSDFDSHTLVNVYNDQQSSFTRRKYQQSYKGIEVVGGTYILHSKAGKLLKTTGVIFPYIDTDVKPKIQFDQAQNLATDYLSDKFKDELSQNAEWKEYAHRLCIIDKAFPEFSSDMKLAYEMVLSAEGKSFPIKQKIYVNAHNGEVLSHFTKIIHESVPATVKTLRYGTQILVADSITTDSFVLRDLSRGNGIYTLDQDRNVFSDSDNYWDNFNKDRDEIAGDAHYCASKFYDMLGERLNWNGLDGEGEELISVVHARGRYYNNAYWDGVRTNYGNGDCDRYHPFTVLDVVGHEFTHGITERTSDLVYAYEPGAMNEAISDIFGKSLEYYVDPDGFNWIVGDKLRKSDEVNIIRSMSDPNLRNHPKYYGGNHWYVGAADNGGVHRNSGLLNYWFYLLVEGIEDVNEKGEAFSVSKIGWQKAMHIVFGMNAGYFTEMSGYVDALYLSLEVCNDLYGEDSDEAKQVLEAWRAVGLFPGIDDLDLELVYDTDRLSLCPNEEAYVTVSIANVGKLDFPGDTTINVYLSQTNVDLLTEELYLQDNLVVGDTIEFTFQTALINDPDFDGDFIMTLDKTDLNNFNNSKTARLVASEVNGLDIMLSQFEFLTSGKCGSNDIERYRYGIRNEGCKVIPKDDTIYFDVVTNVGDFTFSRRIFSDNDPGDYQGGSASLLSENIPFGITEYVATFRYGGEGKPENNVIEAVVEFRDFISEGYIENFGENLEKKKYGLNINSFYNQDTIIEYRGNQMLALNGVSQHQNFDSCPDIEGFFEEYNYDTEISFCVDARGMEVPIFEFNLIQLFSEERTAILPESDFAVIVQVETDSLTYPLIYGQNEDVLVNHVFELGKDYQGNIGIRVITVNGGLDDPSVDYFENKDMALFDDFRLYDRLEEEIKYDDSGYLVFPNPTTDLLRIQNIDSEMVFGYNVYNEMGQLIYGKENVRAVDIVDMSNYPSGVYFVQFIEEGEFNTNKRIVKLN